MKSRLLPRESLLERRAGPEGGGLRAEVLELILGAEERERGRLALEIHDGIAQLLACIHYRIYVCETLLSGNPRKAQDELDEIRSLITQSIGEARRLIGSLRPPILVHLGLVPALRKYLEQVQQQGSLWVTFLADDPMPAISPPAETTIYRIVQEAIYNVQKHARATHVEIKVVREGSFLVVEVTDNGQGFDPAQVSSQGNHWGLVSMKERAEFLNGSLEVVSGLGQGTKVRAKLPLTA